MQIMPDSLSPLFCGVCVFLTTLFSSLPSISKENGPLLRKLLPEIYEKYFFIKFSHSFCTLAHISFLLQDQGYLNSLKFGSPKGNYSHFGLDPMEETIKDFWKVCKLSCL